MKKSFADIFKFVLSIIGLIAINYLFKKVIAFIPEKVLITILILSIITSFFRYQATYSITPRKGLEKADLSRIRFAQKWFETRQEGMWKFLIIDGAIILGAILSLCICLLMFLLVWTDGITAHLSSPGDIFTLIGNSYLAGAFIAALLNRIIWHLNERKFNRLTNPIQ